MKYTDNLKYIDLETGEKLIFNFKTWVLVIKGIIINYAHKTETEADYLIEKRNFKIPKTYDEVVFYSHEIEYHWAMLITYGESYWENGVSSETPINFYEWEKKYREKKFLEEESFKFE